MSDIVKRLRAVFHNDRSVELMNREAADEIERLRVIVQGWEHSARNAERDIAALRAERDEARRELCESDTETHGGALLEAQRRGWDCFKEKP